MIMVNFRSDQPGTPVRLSRRVMQAGMPELTCIKGIVVPAR
ncbi:hypothetical protein [Pseudomonas sp. Irchel s3h17]|nr:hypothetical protein [Pseudomonas sp. Irchel s3h17]